MQFLGISVVPVAKEFKVAFVIVYASKHDIITPLCFQFGDKATNPWKHLFAKNAIRQWFEKWIPQYI